MRNRLKIILPAYVQILCVGLCTFCLSHAIPAGAVLSSFALSYLWTLSVKRAVYANFSDRATYAGAAAAGTATAYYLGQFYLTLI